MRKNGNNTQDIRNPFNDKNHGILPGNNLDFVDNVSQFTQTKNGRFHKFGERSNSLQQPTNRGGAHSYRTQASSMTRHNKQQIILDNIKNEATKQNHEIK